MTTSAASSAYEHLQRARGAATVSARLRGDISALGALAQSGCCKLRFPRSDGVGLEAVWLNTAGGVTGGDRLTLTAEADPGAALTVATQTAERAYRSAGGDAVIDVRLRVADEARLDWLPQETIMFDGARLTRRLTVDMAETARLLAVESVILGRAAMGETVRAGAMRDDWRIRRAGRLIYADALRLTDWSALNVPSLLDGARALASVVCAAPNAADFLDSVRRCLADAPLGARGGASALDADLIAVRVLAPCGRSLRAALTPMLTLLRGAPLPRVWSL